MRRTSRGLAIGAAVMISTTGVALAALPRASTHFTGSGEMYMNDAPHWNRSGREPSSFRSSANGRRLLSFRGGYAYYCGGGSGTITARYIDVSKRGTFDYRFSVPSHGPNGQVVGRTYVRIYGAFSSRTHASVNYLFDFVSTGQKIAHPYSPSNSRALGCASWVRGSAHAT
jgi:hypothetical protein